jgi:hypothetical protein
MLTALSAQAAIIDSINADKIPWAGEIGGIGEIGWVYTPRFSYILTGVKSYFANPDTPLYNPFYNVEVEIYDDVPANGGELLRSATFLVWSHITGGTFAPLDISVDSDYFVGFRFSPPFPSVYNTILCNFADSGVSLPAYYGLDNSGAYSIPISDDDFIHPILMFEGVPEPATILLLAFGGLMLRRKR